MLFRSTSKHGIFGSSEAESPLPESNVRLLSERIVEIPIYPISACMGKGFDNEGEACAAIDTLYLSRDSVGVDAPERPFALLVEGNSMSPAIEDGERIVVNPNITLGRGDVCLARIRSNGYLRDAVKFYFPRPDGGCILKSSETSEIQDFIDDWCYTDDQNDDDIAWDEKIEFYTALHDKTPYCNE